MVSYLSDASALFSMPMIASDETFYDDENGVSDSTLPSFFSLLLSYSPL